MKYEIDILIKNHQFPLNIKCIQKSSYAIQNIMGSILISTTSIDTCQKHVDKFGEHICADKNNQ